MDQELGCAIWGCWTRWICADGESDVICNYLCASATVAIGLRLGYGIAVRVVSVAPSLRRFPKPSS